MGSSSSKALLLSGLLASVSGYAIQHPRRGIQPPPAFVEINEKYIDSILATIPTYTCTEETIRVRKSWEALTPTERTAYIDAVKCFNSLPSKADPALYPNNRNRMDDFAVSHAQQTHTVHWSGFFFPWHRLFMWSYETALRDECNYAGAQPYWEISQWEGAMTSSALFDGSPTSFGGNGAFVPNRSPQNSTIILSPPTPPIQFSIPPGTGGGCVEDGGLVPFPISGTTGNPEGFTNGPSCLARDFRPEAISAGASWKNVTDVLALPDIDTFAATVEGPTGLHGAMHSSVGGEALDFYISPVSPDFYFLHTWLDRVWAIWQGQDWETRRDGLSGTATIMNSPPSEDVTLDHVMQFLYAGEDVRVGDAMSTTGGPLCFRYE